MRCGSRHQSVSTRPWPRTMWHHAVAVTWRAAVRGAWRMTTSYLTLRHWNLNSRSVARRVRLDGDAMAVRWGVMKGCGERCGGEHYRDARDILRTIRIVKRPLDIDTTDADAGRSGAAAGERAGRTSRLPRETCYACVSITETVECCDLQKYSGRRCTIYYPSTHYTRIKLSRA